MKKEKQIAKVTRASRGHWPSPGNRRTRDMQIAHPTRNTSFYVCPPAPTVVSLQEVYICPANPPRAEETAAPGVWTGSRS